MKEYYVFDNNNCYSKDKFTYEQAKRSYGTLVNCENCIDCAWCIGCVDCVFCSNCTNSKNLVNCRAIKNGKNIKNKDGTLLNHETTCQSVKEEKQEVFDNKNGKIIDEEWEEVEIEYFCEREAAELLVAKGWLFEWCDMKRKEKVFNCVVCYTAHTGGRLDRINITLSINQSILNELLQLKKNHIYCMKLECDGAKLISEMVKLSATMMGYEIVENWKIIDWYEAPWF